MKSLQINPSKLLGFRLSGSAVAAASKIGAKTGTKGGGDTTLAGSISDMDVDVLFTHV